MTRSIADHGGGARGPTSAGRRVWLQASQRVLKAAEGAVADALLELEQRLPGPPRGAQTTRRLRDVVARDRAAAAAGVQGHARPEPASTAEAAPPTAPSPAPRPAAAACPGEPIRTRTYARLLAAQGEPRRALAIYAHLMEGNPRDASLSIEAIELRRRVELDDDLDRP